MTDDCSNYKRYKQEEERNGGKGIATTIKHSSELKTKKTTVQRQSKQQQNEQQQCNTAAGPVSISQNINCLVPYISRAFRCILSVMTRKNKKFLPVSFRWTEPQQSPCYLEAKNKIHWLLMHKPFFHFMTKNARHSFCTKFLYIVLQKKLWAELQTTFVVIQFIDQLIIYFGKCKVIFP